MGVARETGGGRGELDRRRYQRKLKEEIREKLPDIVANSPIISGPGSAKVPIRIRDELVLPHFVPKQPLMPSHGVGQGDRRPGKKVGERRLSGDGGSGGGQAGDQTGDHEIEIEVTLDELRGMVLEDLKLPDLRDKPTPQQMHPEVAWNTRAHRGSMNALDKKATLKSALRHREGNRVAVTPEDLWYISWTDREKPKTAAVVYFLRDISGSMTAERRYLSKAVAWWVAMWLQTQYERCEVCFFVHDIEVAEVDEERFYHLTSGGGTMFAPAYRRLREHMDKFYPVSAYNRYVLHFTDGELFDTGLMQEALHDLIEGVNFMGIVLTQVLESLGTAYQNLFKSEQEKADRLRVVSIGDRGQVVQTVRQLFQ